MLWACAGSGNRRPPVPNQEQARAQTPIAQTPLRRDASVPRAQGPDAGAAARAAAAIPRVWVGQGTQDDGQSWSMELTVRAFGPGHCADVVYPADDQKPMPCATEWFCEDDSSDRLLRGVERVTKGRDRCIDWCEFSADLEKAIVVFKCRDVNGTARLQPARP
jgi:hypothetical protein